jgi:hypothetical protein
MLAIDPGANGGIAVAITECYDSADFLHANYVIEAHPMPDNDNSIKYILTAAERAGSKTAYMEELVKFTGTNMPSSSMAVYASNWGTLKGMLNVLGFRLILVPPKKWQKALGLGSAKGLSRTQWKGKLKQKASELFPSINVTLKTCDALLILEAARRGLLG